MARAPAAELWPTTNDLAWLLRAAGRRPSPREWRLLCCACFRALYGDRVKDARTAAAVAAAERYAEGEATKQELTAARRQARRAGEPSPFVKRATWWTTYGRPRAALARLIRAEYPAAWVTRWDQVPPRPRGPLSASEEARLCALVRDVFTNPFRPEPALPRGGEIDRLARAAYDEPAADRLAVLADALEDAGCSDLAVLSHCRADAVHVRGCWVLDLLLGKS